MAKGGTGRRKAPAGRLFALLAALLLAGTAGIGTAEELTGLSETDEMILKAPEVTLGQYAADRYDLSVDGRRMSVRSDPGLPGRGQANPDGNEPDYIGVTGFAVIPNDPDIGKYIGSTGLTWEVPVYRQPKEGKPLVRKGSLAHKTSVLVAGQALEPDGKGGYTGWLNVVRLDNRTMCWLHVSCFVTMPYWSLPAEQIPAYGYAVAVYRRGSGTAPEDGEGIPYRLADNTVVLIPFEGALAAESPELEELTVQGIVFTGEDGTGDPALLYFRNDELIPVY